MTKWIDYPARILRFKFCLFLINSPMIPRSSYPKVIDYVEVIRCCLVMCCDSCSVEDFNSAVFYQGLNLIFFVAGCSEVIPFRKKSHMFYNEGFTGVRFQLLDQTRVDVSCGFEKLEKKI